MTALSSAKLAAAALVAALGVGIVIVVYATAQEENPQVAALNRCERAIAMVEQHLKDIQIDTSATGNTAAGAATATDADTDKTPGMNMMQRDRALAACVLDCDYIYEALDRIISDGDTGE